MAGLCLSEARGTWTHPSAPGYQGAWWSVPVLMITGYVASTLPSVSLEPWMTDWPCHPISL